MESDQGKPGGQGEPPPKDADAGRGPAQDLADGLELMLRAARKAVKNIDPAKLEQLGQRAKSGLENLDRGKVEQFGRKAARHLDPRKVEEVAEQAGRELLAVVERVAERIDSMVTGAQRGRTEGQAPPAEQPGEPTAEQPGEPEQRNAGDASPERRRVRVDPEE
jgi:hypothetical protein